MLFAGAEKIPRMDEYNDRLAAALARSGASRADLAAALKCSVQAVGDALAGKTRAFTARNNVLAAEFLNVSSRWLALGVGPMVDDDQLSADVLEVAKLAQSLRGEDRQELLRMWRWSAEAISRRTAGPDPAFDVLDGDSQTPRLTLKNN